MTRKQTAAIVLVVLALGAISNGAGSLTDYFWVSVLALAPMFLQWATSPKDKKPEAVTLVAARLNEALEREREHNRVLSSLVADHALMVERLRGEIEAVRAMARSIMDGEWADHLYPDGVLAEVEMAFSKLVNQFNAATRQAPAQPQEQSDETASH